MFVCGCEDMMDAADEGMGPIPIVLARFESRLG